MRKIKFLVPLSMVLVMYGSLQAFEPVNESQDNAVEIEESVVAQATDWVDVAQNQYFSSDFHYDANEKIAKWPYENDDQVPPAYVDENYQTWQDIQKIHGSPIAVQFNPDQSGDIKVDRFVLKDESGTVIDTELAQDNLSDKEYAIVPKSRLDWEKTYSVDLDYHEDGVAKTEHWTFATQKLEHPVYEIADNSQRHDVARGSTYAFYAKNSNANVDASFQHDGSFSVDATVDHDTFYAKVDATVGSDAVATINGEEHKFHVFTDEITKLEFDQVGDNSVSLKWYHENSGEEKGYKIYRDGKFLTKVSSDTRVYTDKDVKPGVSYNYTVKVTNDS